MWQMPWAVQSSKLGPKLLDLDADGDGGDLVHCSWWQPHGQAAARRSTGDCDRCDPERHEKMKMKTHCDGSRPWTTWAQRCGQFCDDAAVCALCNEMQR